MNNTIVFNVDWGFLPFSCIPKPLFSVPDHHSHFHHHRSSERHSGHLQCYRSKKVCVSSTRLHQYSEKGCTEHNTTSLTPTPSSLMVSPTNPHVRRFQSFWSQIEIEFLKVQTFFLSFQTLVLLLVLPNFFNLENWVCQFFKYRFFSKLFQFLGLLIAEILNHSMLRGL